MRICTICGGTERLLKSSNKCAPCKYKQKEERQNKRCAEFGLLRNKLTDKELEMRLSARSVIGNSSVSATTYSCSVITCKIPAEEFHHYDYSDPSGVIPLCRSHHRKFHLNWKANTPFKVRK